MWKPEGESYVWVRVPDLPKGQNFCYTVDMTSYEKIYDRAADNYGYITTREAAELGVPKSEMSALVKRNRLVHKGYGVYRLATHYQPSEYDGYAEAVLLGGMGAVIGERLADGVRKAERNGELRLGEAEKLLKEIAS